MPQKRTILPLFTLIVFAFLKMEVCAVPAYPYKINVETYNGKTVEIYMRGDENHKYAVTTDGYTLLSDSDGWWYAEATSEGNVVKSSFKLVPYDDEPLELRNFKKDCPRGLCTDSKAHGENNAVNVLRKAKSNEPIVGERHALVILMQYKDLAFKRTREDFMALFNTLDYHENDATGSVRDFYRFASQGQLDYISDVYGPYTSQHPMSYYGNNVTAGANDAHALELCIEAVKSLPDNLDHTLYDNDGDGLVDNVHIIFAGYGEEAGGSSDAIWAHEYPHRIALHNEVGYSLAGYSCSPELRGNRGSKISHIGVVCHELGHSLGAMDYYDTNYNTGGGFDGTGKWDIMASGSWNDEGRTPPNFNPYVRSTIFGWNKQVLLESNQQVVMPRMETDNAEQSIVYRLETGSSNDYFLLENRQQYLFDKELPGAGLMIYHVHPNIEKYRSTNSINSTHPQGLYPVCASGSDPARKDYGNINSSGCPFPGTKDVKMFTPSTFPSALAWNGSAALVELSNITMSNGNIIVTTGDDVDIDRDDPDDKPEMELLYKESFESGIDSGMTVVSVMGKNKWRTYKKGNLVVGSEIIPEATDGDRVLMLYGGKENATSESEVIGPNLSVVSGVDYSISFDIYTYANPTSPIPSFELYVEDEYGEYNIYSCNELFNQWKHIEVPVTFAGNSFRYKLYGRINSGGIFFDNMTVYQEKGSNTIHSLQSTFNECNQYDLYSVDGTYLGNSFGHIHRLPTGLYLVRKGKKIQKIVVK